MKASIIITTVVIFSAVILSSCDVVFAKNSSPSGDIDQLIVDIEPGAVEIGESLINPASPLYFLKNLREKIELAIAVTSIVKAERELEFAQRRLREVKSLIKNRNQQLIPATLEKYKGHLAKVDELSLGDENLQVNIGEAVVRHLDVLQRVYDMVGNPEAKRAIRAAVEKAAEHNRILLARLSLVQQQKLIKLIALRQAAGCKFLAKEATNSALNSAEKEILQAEVVNCKKNIQQELKDELREQIMRRKTPLSL